MQRCGGRNSIGIGRVIAPGFAARGASVAIHHAGRHRS